MNKPKLLIVDDDEAIRTQLKYALRDDVTLLFAEDRGGALTTLRAEHLELVLQDFGNLLLGLRPARRLMRFWLWPAAQRTSQLTKRKQLA